MPSLKIVAWDGYERAETIIMKAGHELKRSNQSTSVELPVLYDSTTT